MTPLPSAFTLSMKRSKFFENCVFSAKDVTAFSVTSCAAAGLAAVMASASSAASTDVVFMMISPLGAANAAAMAEGYGQTPARATADRRGQSAVQAACTACVNSATFFWWLIAAWIPVVL